MSKRLSKISRDLHVGISTIVEFLNSNGFDCEEDPTLMIQEDVVDFLKNNISSFISAEKPLTPMSKKVEQEVKDEKDTIDIPLELKIINEASKHTKLIEKVIGFTDFDWHYTVAKFTGTCSHPVDFTLFDEVLCGILLNRQMSAVEIGKILGLDIDTDPAEKDILMSAINDLKKDRMLEGDESIYWLSDIGAEYARNGVKFSTFTRDFELYIDAVAGMKGNIKKIFSNLRSEKQPSFSHENLPSGIEDVKVLAEAQAPEIHFPEKNYFLQSCTPIGVKGYIAKLWVVLVENFRDKTSRVLVYDDISGKIIEPLSKAISNMEDQKQLILNKLLSDSDSADFSVEITSEEKNEAQIEQENELIERQNQIDTAIEQQDVQAIVAIQEEIRQVKRHFNSLEFEVELKRLFDETNGEMWIISPWIKNATFKRIPFFKDYMKKGGKIFVAYSAPEDGISSMVYQEPYDKLMELDRQYQNFYIHQLPAFHYKRVWLLNDGTGALYYTGSYNILSFFVQQGYTNIRQEEMTKLDWNEEEYAVYDDVLIQFGVKYFNQAADELNSLCKNAPAVLDKAFLKKLKAFNYSKLRIFVGRGIEQIDEMFKQIEEAKEANLKLFKDKYSVQELDAIYKEALKIGQNMVPVDRKRAIQSRLNILLNEFPEVEEQAKLVEVKELIQNIKIPKFDKKQKGKGQK